MILSVFSADSSWAGRTIAGYLLLVEIPKLPSAFPSVEGNQYIPRQPCVVFEVLGERSFP